MTTPNAYAIPESRACCERDVRPDEIGPQHWILREDVLADPDLERAAHILRDLLHAINTT